mmetsp:Transcript_9210/g.6558  ORF Transcript_9210/g.6558 Transcript_9210/m.6558 type:complete len:119 (+) Transcript_9210:393-749(+)
MLIEWFTDDKTLCFIFVVVLQALDFWVTKNITGRILVGLRWWSRIKDNGKEEWIYESLTNRDNNKVDSRVFWISNYMTPLLWLLFGLIAVLSLSINNGTICIVCFLMSSTQLYAYIRC